MANVNLVFKLEHPDWQIMRVNIRRLFIGLNIVQASWVLEACSVLFFPCGFVASCTDGSLIIKRGSTDLVLVTRVVLCLMI